MKVIFLDIDGVLNTLNTFLDKLYYEKLNGGFVLEIDDYRLERLKRLVDETGAVIVLSSWWRIYYKKENGKVIPNHEMAVYLNEKFAEYGLSIYDIVPHDGIVHKGKDRQRGKEITEYLNLHDEIDSYIIIDDKTFDLKEHLDSVIGIFNEPDSYNIDENGLLDYHIDKGIKKLNEMDIKKVLK